MDGMGSFWTTYHEDTDDLKKMLLYTTLELETVKSSALESQQNVKNLLDLLNVAYKERDDARDQLHKIFNKINASSQIELTNVEFNQVVQPESPSLTPAKVNSCITESNSISGTTYNPQSHISSPVDSLFDAAVSSPELSNTNMADSSNNMGLLKQKLAQESNNACTIMSSGVVVSRGASIKADPADEIIDSLVKGRPLPQKGNLLQAVMDAAPLLQTVLVAGPMPRWRNPPPLQPFKIPPVLIKGCEAAVSFSDQKPMTKTNPAYVVHTTQKLTSYSEMCRGFSQTCSAAILNFNNVNPSRMQTAGSCFDHQVPIAKRYRLQ